MAVQIVVEAGRILAHIALGVEIIGKLKINARDPSGKFQALGKIVADLSVIAPVMADFVCAAVMVVAPVIARGLDAQTLVTKATVNGDIGRAVAVVDVLKAGGLIDRIKGRGNPDG